MVPPLSGDIVHFPIVNHKLQECLLMYKIRRCIIENYFFGRVQKVLEKFEVDYDERYIFKAVE